MRDTVDENFILFQFQNIFLLKENILKRIKSFFFMNVYHLMYFDRNRVIMEAEAEAEAIRVSDILKYMLY